MGKPPRLAGRQAGCACRGWYQGRMDARLGPSDGAGRALRMGAMVAVLNVLIDPILPIFAIMAFGYALGMSGKTSVEDARTINHFALTVPLPIMLFGLLGAAPIRSIHPVPALVYIGAEAVVFAIGFALAYGVFRRGPAESVLLAFCGIFANNVFYVLPIATLLYGKAQVLPVTTIIIIDTTVTMAGALVALQIINLGRITPGAVIRTLARTPILQAIALGILFNLARIPIPGAVQTFIDFNGHAAAPIALFALGVVMSQTRLAMDAMVLCFTLLKLIVFPAVVWVGMEALAGAADGKAQFLLGSAGPAGAMAFSLALHQNVRTDAIAQIIIWTSVLTLVSLAVLA